MIILFEPLVHVLKLGGLREVLEVLGGPWEDCSFKSGSLIRKLNTLLHVSVNSITST